MKLLIIRQADKYVICRETRDYRMFLAKRYATRKLDIMNKKGELLLRVNKKKKKWFGPPLEVFYTVTVSNDHVYEVRHNEHWQMSDGKTLYQYHTQSVFRDHVQVATVSWESPSADEDIIHVEMNEEDDQLQILGFIMIFNPLIKFR